MPIFVLVVILKQSLHSQVPGEEVGRQIRNAKSQFRNVKNQSETESCFDRLIKQKG